MPERALQIEWIAVLAGAKPACRQIVPAAEAERLAAEARACGLVAIAQDAREWVAGWTTGAPAGRDTLLYLALTEDRAAAALAAERSIHQRDIRGGWALGRALGYPECCIDFYEARRTAPNAQIRFDALVAMIGAPDYRLCNLDGGDALISHFPCRYDCAESIARASATLAALRAATPSEAEKIVEALKCVGILFREGGEIRLHPRPPHPDGSFRYWTPAHSDRMPELSAADEIVIGSDLIKLRRGGNPIGEVRIDPARVRVARFG